jgi:hypothetical protein
MGIVPTKESPQGRKPAYLFYPIEEPGMLISENVGSFGWWNFFRSITLVKTRPTIIKDMLS